MLEEAQSALFPLWPRLVAMPASEVVAGSLEGADEGRHSRAGADGDGKRAALKARHKTGSATTSGTVQRVVSLPLAMVRSKQ